MYMSVDNNPHKSRIRIRYPDGFEIEIEGDEQFVKAQKEELLNIKTNQKIIQENNTIKDKEISQSISRIIDYRDNIPFIKFKIPELDEKMAMLIILFAYNKLNKIENISALAISKALRLSGYNPKRIDTIANSLIKDDSIKATGSKRTRQYILTEKGKAKATVKIINILNHLNQKV